MATTAHHVDFAQQPSSNGQPHLNRPTIHPSRSAQVPGKPETPAKPKEKSAKKKAYLVKKAKKHKILAKAKRDAAPKNKDPSAVLIGSTPIPTASTITASNGTINAEAGPSRIPAIPSISSLKAKQAVNGESRKRKDRGDDDDEGVAVAGGVDDGEEDRERRRKEKKEKRANRDPEERKRRKEEKAALRAKAAAKEAKGKAKETAALKTDVGAVETVEGREKDQALEAEDEEMPEVEDEVEVEEDEEGTDDEVADVDETEDRARKISPPPLEAFPLPTPAVAPDPALLSRQGLPANLANATIISQDLRLPLDGVSAKTTEGEEISISEKMSGHLKEMGVQDFFAVQAAMLPKLMSIPLVGNPFQPMNDYLISAPTGSGKTLAYSIPIVHVLAPRRVTRLRALIVLPTRDLVVQVRETMEALAKGTNLTIGTATGHQSFTHEQNQLIADRETKLLGGSSKVDILIATPGRLIDHLTQTPNFTLQHLRFLVIDEADRLLNQSFQNWLQQVLSHVRPPTQRVELPADFVRKPWDLYASEWNVAYGDVDVTSEYYRPPVSTCHKLLFSATLTRDPAAIASLNLRDPQYFIVQESEYLDTTIGESFALPATLTERYLALPPQLKPLNLIHLLHSAEYRVRGGLVFTKSVESVSRLVSLLTTFEEEYGAGAKEKVVVKGYTSDMKSAERQRVLSSFTKGEVHLLVCSDVIARGMDLPVVEHVISYDTPIDMRKYVHRVGRTARAGRAGTAWTLVEKQEALHFKGMMKVAGRDKKVKKIKVQEDQLQPYREAYDRAVERVREIYTRHE